MESCSCEVGFKWNRAPDRVLWGRIQMEPRSCEVGFQIEPHSCEVEFKWHISLGIPSHTGP